MHLQQSVCTLKIQPSQKDNCLYSGGHHQIAWRGGDFCRIIFIYYTREIESFILDDQRYLGFLSILTLLWCTTFALPEKRFHNCLWGGIPSGRMGFECRRIRGPWHGLARLVTNSFSGAQFLLYQISFWTSLEPADPGADPGFRRGGGGSYRNLGQKIGVFRMFMTFHCACKRLLLMTRLHLTCAKQA